MLITLLARKSQQIYADRKGFRGVYMLRSICKETDLGAQCAYKHVRITVNMLILENKFARTHSAVERQDGEVQWCKRCCLKIHGKDVWE
jgi:hypothetical protein